MRKKRVEISAKLFKGLVADWVVPVIDEKIGERAFISKEVFDKLMRDFIEPAIDCAVTKKIAEITELKGQVVRIIKKEVRKELRVMLGMEEK